MFVLDFHGLNSVPEAPGQGTAGRRDTGRRTQFRGGRARRNAALHAEPDALGGGAARKRPQEQLAVFLVTLY